MAILYLGDTLGHPGHSFPRPFKHGFDLICLFNLSCSPRLRDQWMVVGGPCSKPAEVVGAAIPRDHPATVNWITLKRWNKVKHGETHWNTTLFRPQTPKTIQNHHVSRASKSRHVFATKSSGFFTPGFQTQWAKCAAKEVERAPMVGCPGFPFLSWRDGGDSWWDSQWDLEPQLDSMDFADFVDGKNANLCRLGTVHEIMIWYDSPNLGLRISNSPSKIVTGLLHPFTLWQSVTCLVEKSPADDFPKNVPAMFGDTLQ